MIYSLAASNYMCWCTYRLEFAFCCLHLYLFETHPIKVFQLTFFLPVKMLCHQQHLSPGDHTRLLTCTWRHRSVCCYARPQLEQTVAQLQQENEATLGKLRAHDDAAKKALNQLQADLQSKLSQVSRISCWFNSSCNWHGCRSLNRNVLNLHTILSTNCNIMVCKLSLHLLYVGFC